MSTRKWAEKQIRVNLTQSEWERLEAYCKLEERTYTEVVRECIRRLGVKTTKISEK